MWSHIWAQILTQPMKIFEIKVISWWEILLKISPKQGRSGVALPPLRIVIKTIQEKKQMFTKTFDKRPKPTQSSLHFGWDSGLTTSSACQKKYNHPFLPDAFTQGETCSFAFPCHDNHMPAMIWFGFISQPAFETITILLIVRRKGLKWHLKLT